MERQPAPQVYGRSSPSPSETPSEASTAEVCRRLGVVQDGVQAGGGGDSFEARFEVRGLLGSGAFGAVFTARLRGTEGEWCAVKKVNGGLQKQAAGLR